jgi:hypothetical protein
MVGNGRQNVFWPQRPAPVEVDDGPAAEDEALRQKVGLELLDALDLPPGLHGSRPLQPDVADGVIGTDTKVVDLGSML